MLFTIKRASQSHVYITPREIHYKCAHTIHGGPQCWACCTVEKIVSDSVKNSVNTRPQSWDCRRTNSECARCWPQILYNSLALFSLSIFSFHWQFDVGGSAMKTTKKRHYTLCFEIIHSLFFTIASLLFFIIHIFLLISRGFHFTSRAFASFCVLEVLQLWIELVGAFCV